MKIELNTTGVPAYVEIYNSLYADITGGVYPAGECLPGEIALAQKYQVSRNTLRQAMAILCEDGLLIRSRGKGTLVAQPVNKTLWAEHIPLIKTKAAETSGLFLLPRIILNLFCPQRPRRSAIILIAKCFHAGPAIIVNAQPRRSERMRTPQGLKHLPAQQT